MANEAADVKRALTQTAGDGAVLVPDDPLSVNERARIAELHRLPAVAGHTQIAEAGVMMAYGPSRIVEVDEFGREIGQQFQIAGRGPILMVML